MDKQSEHIRRYEIEMLKPWFKKGNRVLEIGGEYGLQASIIASWGCEVVSIDVAPKESEYYTVLPCDGVLLPFRNETFDIIFSSNTLEHVKHLNLLLAEVRRVMVTEGWGIHVMPNSVWRFWSNLAHYLDLIRKFLTGVYGLSYIIRRELFPRRHGEKGNVLSEIYYFSKIYWKRFLEASEFTVVRIEGNGLFYMSPCIFPNASLKIGRILSRILGSVSNTYFTHKSELK